MFNRKAQIGRILSSSVMLIILFAILVISALIFLFIFSLNDDNSTGDVNDIKKFTDESTRIGSKVLFDVFLNDKVSKEDLGDEISIEAMINIASGTVGDRQKNFLEIIYKRFHERFSCNGLNKLKIQKFDRQNLKKWVYVDYPLKEGKKINEFDFPIEEVSARSTEYSAFCLNNNLAVNGYSKEIDKRNHVCVFVEEVVKC